jgi:outer membrane protein assembly factor BamB
MCFDASSGRFLWQWVVPKREEDRYFDWPNSGMSSTVTVEGDRVYLVDNRGEVACLDLNGMSDGNDGPFLDEGRHMTPASLPALSPGPTDADILWLFDLTARAGIWSHDAAHSSILIHGPHLYLNTGTGVDNTHKRIRTPNAPSLVVLDKSTGQWLGREDEGHAARIFHCTWSSPSLATVGNRPLLFFAGGEGLVYAYEPLATDPAPASPSLPVATLRNVWQFDIDPSAPKEDVHRYNSNRREGPSTIFGMPVYHDNRVYVAGGGDLWWGKKGAWLQAIAADREGDITATGGLWSYPLEEHVLSTPAVHEGLVYIADCGKTVHCVDARTGQAHWTHEAQGDFWASPLVADGRLSQHRRPHPHRPRVLHDLQWPDRRSSRHHELQPAARRRRRLGRHLRQPC